MQVEMDVIESSSKVKRRAHISPMICSGNDLMNNMHYFVTKAVCLIAYVL